MARKVVRAALAAASLTLALAAPAGASIVADTDGDKVFDNLETRLAFLSGAETVDVIVRLRADATSARVSGIADEVGGFETDRRFTLVDAFSARLTRADVRAVAELADVVSVEADAPIRAFNDSAQDAFGVTKARLDAGVDGDGDGSAATYSAGDLVAAVIDTGIDAAHQDLDEGKVLAFADCVGHPCALTSPSDPNGHGTHVAATIAGEGDARPDRRYRGVAPAAGLVGLRVLNAAGSGSMSDFIAALQWVVLNRATYGIEVVNASLGAEGCSNGLDASSVAVDNAVTAGLTVVVAAGNEGPGSCTIGAPGAARNAVTAGAMADLGVGGFSLAGFSSRGPTQDGRPKPDVVAPGVSVTSAAAGTSSLYATGSGTSMASPFVAGTALLMLDANPSLTPAQVKAAMTSTAVDWGSTGADPEYGFGRLDAYAAIKAGGASISAPPLSPAHALRSGSFLGTGSSTDFLFTLSSPSFPLAATLTLPTWSPAAGPTVNISILDPNGVLVASGGQDGRHAEASVAPAQSGTYTVRVRSTFGSGSFLLDVSGGFAPGPAPTSPPTVSGTAEAGETLAATVGAWSGTGALAYTYEWRRCDAAGLGCTPIIGAVLGSYAVPASDVGSTLRVAVTAVDSVGTSMSISAPTAVVAPAADRQAPIVRALSSQGKRGRSVKLLYRVTEQSSRSRERVKVYRGKKVLRTLSVPLSTREAGRTYYVFWRAPKKPARLRFCVEAWDANGNKSAPRCASLRIR